MKQFNLWSGAGLLFFLLLTTSCRPDDENIPSLPLNETALEYSSFDEPKDPPKDVPKDRDNWKLYVK